MIAFGWSAGDLAMATKVIVKVAKAFKDADGAADRYRQAQNFLSGFNVTIERMKSYIEDYPNEACSADLAEQLKSIDQPWKSFQQYLDKYERSLSQTSQRSRLAKTPRIIQYTVGELNNEVARLEAAIMTPLKVLDSMLSLHLLHSLRTSNTKLPTSDQLAQLVNAMQLAYKSVDIHSTSNEGHNVTREREDPNESRIQDLTQLIEERFLRLNELLEREAQKSQSEADASEERLARRVEDAQADLTSLWRSLNIEMQRIQRDLVSQGLALKADVDREKEALTDAMNNIHEEQEVMSKRLETSLEKHIEKLQASLKDGHETTCSETRPKSFEAQLATTQTIIMLLSYLVAGVTAAFLSQNAYFAQTDRGTAVGYREHKPYTAVHGEQHVPPMRSAVRSAAPVERPSALRTPAWHGVQAPTEFKGRRRRPSGQTQLPDTRADRWRDTVLGVDPDANHKTFRCVFKFLNCSYDSDNEEEWKTHCLAHYRGRSPRRSVQCTVCDDSRAFDCSSTAWDWYMTHMASHMRDGRHAEPSRPDFHLFQDLWMQRVIDDDQLRSLRIPPHSLQQLMVSSPRNTDDQDRSDRDDRDDGGEGGGEGNSDGSPPNDTPDKNADNKGPGNGANNMKQGRRHQCRRDGCYQPSKLAIDEVSLRRAVVQC